MRNERDIIVILGPTASGKSDLGVRLARTFNGVVLSADSRQVYRGLDLGTGKITHQEMSGVRHELLDIASPRGQYSVSRFVRDAMRVIHTIPLERPIFIVGGSPFYIDALLKPGSFSHVPPDPKLRRRLASRTTAQLFAQLRRLDPTRATTIDRANRRRLERAIEIARGTPSPIAPPAFTFRVLKIGIRVKQSTLFARIDARVDRRMTAGMLREVARLHRHGLSWKRLDAFGLEYRFLARIIRGHVSRREGITQLKTAIHHFARRQMTWWRRDDEIVWIEKPSAANALVRTFLRNR